MRSEPSPKESIHALVGAGAHATVGPARVALVQRRAAAERLEEDAGEGTPDELGREGGKKGRGEGGGHEGEFVGVEDVSVPCGGGTLGHREQ